MAPVCKAIFKICTTRRLFDHSITGCPKNQFIEQLVINNHWLVLINLNDSLLCRLKANLVLNESFQLFIGVGDAQQDGALSWIFPTSFQRISVLLDRRLDLNILQLQFTENLHCHRYEVGISPEHDGWWLQWVRESCPNGAWHFYLIRGL